MFVINLFILLGQINEYKYTSKGFNSFKYSTIPSSEN